MKKKISSKLSDVLERLLFHNNREFQFYFYFLNYVDFYEDDTINPATMCVTVKDMRLALIYHPQFVEESTEIELMALLIHEIKHLLHNHLERGKYYDRKFANISMDMIINHLIEKFHKSVHLPKITKDRLEKHLEEAKKNGITPDPELVKRLYKKIGDSACVKLDPNYKGELVFEPLYKWLKEEKQKDDEGKSCALSQDTKDMLDSFPTGETTDGHLPSDELMDEIKKQLGKEAFEKTKLQMRGLGSSDIEESMKMLLKEPKNNNLRLLKRVIAALKGRQKIDSYHRMNRRIPGLKGVKKVSQQINVGLDVSGSMYGRFDVVLSEIYRDGYEIDLVQVDTKIQKVDRIKKKSELKSLIIKGFGGTVLQPFVDYVLDPKNKMYKAPTIILTDGDCDSLDFRGSAHQFLILSLREVKYRNGANVKQIIIEGT